MRRDRELEPYFEEAASWDLDRARQASRSARFGWSVAGIACFVIVLLAGALMLLTPLKRVEPFLIRVDRTTGIVDVVPTYSGHATLSEAVTRYFLIHYVSVCERFNYATAESDYEECGAFQTPQENEAWYARWNPSNPASPLNAHKDGSTVTVSVEDVSFFKRASGIQNLVQVRYLTSLREGSGAAGAERHWIATIEYAYGKPSSSAKERLLNPLGFKVVSLTREPEVLSSAGAAPTATSQMRGATP
ncbi:MAG: virB8 family protein [Steroidobacteraceae bacterium]